MIEATHPTGISFNRTWKRSGGQMDGRAENLGVRSDFDTLSFCTIKGMIDVIQQKFLSAKIVKGRPVKNSSIATLKMASVPTFFFLLTFVVMFSDAMQALKGQDGQILFFNTGISGMLKNTYPQKPLTGFFCDD